MNTLIQQIQLADKYSRLKEDGTKETWPEVVNRVISFLQDEIQIKQNRRIPTIWWEEIRGYMLRMEVLPSMRIVQMAGPALARDHVGAYNCAFIHLDSPSALSELLYVMMQGTGIGFSVEDDIIAKWPAVQRSDFTPPRSTWIIEDSTEGWVDAYKHGIMTWMEGLDVEFDFSRIRPAGSLLKTKGGYASGPEPFEHLLRETRKIILGAQGRQLRPFEVHRLATLAGSIVVVGGVRRAAQISLSSLRNSEMRDCKRGEFWHQYPELSMANNSAVIPNLDGFDAEWAALQSSGTGERGVFNPFGPIPARRMEKRFGANPCGEILLRSRQFCNLSIAVARPDDTVQTLRTKVRIATILGTIQSCLTYFPNLPSEWKENCEEERLLGVDITGTMDCPLLQHTDEKTAGLLEMLRDYAIETNIEAAQILGIEPSRAVTCNKPSGNSSQLLDCASGIHPRYAPYYIRRLRIGRDTPLAQHLKDMGVPVHPEVGQTDLESSLVWVFDLPAKAPNCSIVRADVDAISQLEYWKMWKIHWTEHNPSCTIYVGQDEWDQVREWVKDNWNIIGGLSFLPRNDHIYSLAPYEEITEEQYDTLARRIQWDGGSFFQWAGSEAGATDAACAGDFCEF